MACHERCYYGCARAHILLAGGNRSEALALAESVVAERDHQGLGHDRIKESFALAVLAALTLDRVDKADELLAVVEQAAPGPRPQFLNAQLARIRAQLAARSGNTEEAERLFKRAGGLFQEPRFRSIWPSRGLNSRMARRARARGGGAAAGGGSTQDL